MKKIILVLATITLLSASLVACDNNEKGNENNPITTQVETNTPNETSVPEVTITPSENELVNSGEDGQEVINEPSETTTEEPTETTEPTDVPTETPKQNEQNSEYTIIKFSDMYETKGNIKNVSTMLKNLNGKKVQIKGYPAVQSPLDESFVYLNNQPFVTCPFCTIGDVTKLEVIPIFMANKSKIKYTENALNVYGKLEVASKVDSEGYTTQFRIYADKVEEVQDTGDNKKINEYYAALSQGGMIFDIQTLQMNIEYATNPQYMAYYDEQLQTGKTQMINNLVVAKGIAEEYKFFDDQYAHGMKYLEYIKECPDIVKSLAPTDTRLKALNDELVEIYEKQIKVMEKYDKVCTDIDSNKNSLNLEQANKYLNQLKAINPENLKLYEQFTAWNNKLRE